MTTRAEFLARIRAAVGRTRGLFSAAVAERPADPAAAAETIRRELSERWRETLGWFHREFERVGGVFHRVATLDEVPEVVGRIARERGATRLVAWHPSALGADLGSALAAQGLETHATPPGEVADSGERARWRAVAAAADLGLTGVDLAIAETGSLVLISGPGRARSTSLLPACHIAAFDRTVLVESLQQAGVFLEAWHAGARTAWRGATVSVVTGPSRTADIELTLTRGVHGPREVHAIFVETEIRD